MAVSSKSLTGMLSLFHSSIKTPLPKYFLPRITARRSISASQIKQKQNAKAKRKTEFAGAAQVKRRTRSDRELDGDSFMKYHGEDNKSGHTPVMIGEVLDVFASVPLRSFVDCTLGAAGHSSAIIQAHGEMKLFVGIDVDPAAHEIADARIKGILGCDTCEPTSELCIHTFVQNYRSIKSVLGGIDEALLGAGVSGILMDLGMSSMQVNNAERGFSVLGDGPLDMRMNPQVSLKAEDILNSWPDDEVGKVLREYGEESNWHRLQKKIVNARLHGGLHSTAELVNLIRSSTCGTRGLVCLF
ncbi:OLC1v1030591C1 [Oldenlandia corymbosa var. corymbosa]|uniref:OLC1v1030591C1 n=1 Tax=Oldenlandia corymbosa var. corymbosa TaxID=529605 RepID=A0AAV1CGC4_OLDCO|nr:OLC1v1030591C1 [Oldenlandia corymbosa var. corymbosa]